MRLTVRAKLAERGLDVDLSAASGHAVALVGPNGAGKSTVLDIIAGLLRPEEAVVALGDRLLTETGGRRAWVPPHARRIALLAQDPMLFPHLSVADNVAFGPRSAGLPRRAADARAREWLERLGVDAFAGRRPASLSGGQAQRVAIARALAAEPDLLLLDEPLAALDVDVAGTVRAILREQLAGRTALLVTHDPVDALLLADQVVVLEAGRVVEAGPTGDVLARPRSGFAARLAGMNLITGKWRDGVLTSADGRVVHGSPHPEPTPGGPAVATFAPSAVSVFLTEPHGSPRNHLTVVLERVEPLGGIVRVRGGGLAADVTPQAVAELALAPGLRVVFAVKATEVSIYPA